MIESQYSEYYMGVGVEYGFSWASMSLFRFVRASILPYSSLSSIYGYFDTNSSNLLATGRNFTILNYVLKIPPNTVNGYGYGLQAGNLLKTLLINYARFFSINLI